MRFDLWYLCRYTLKKGVNFWLKDIFKFMFYFFFSNTSLYTLLRTRIFHAINMMSLLIYVHPLRLEFIFMLLVLFSDLIVVSVVTESVAPEFFTVLWDRDRKPQALHWTVYIHKQFLRQLYPFWAPRRHFSACWTAWRKQGYCSLRYCDNLSSQDTEYPFLKAFVLIFSLH